MDHWILIIAACALVLGLWINVRFLKRILLISSCTDKVSVRGCLKAAVSVIYFIVAYSILIVAGGKSMMLYLNSQLSNEYIPYVINGLIMLLTSTFTWWLINKKNRQ
jgi:hypothetical protein